MIPLGPWSKQMLLVYWSNLDSFRFPAAHCVPLRESTVFQTIAKKLNLNVTYFHAATIEEEETTLSGEKNKSS